MSEHFQTRARGEPESDQDYHDDVGNVALVTPTTKPPASGSRCMWTRTRCGTSTPWWSSAATCDHYWTLCARPGSSSNHAGFPRLPTVWRHDPDHLEVAQDVTQTARLTPGAASGNSPSLDDGRVANALSRISARTTRPWSTDALAPTMTAGYAGCGVCGARFWAETWTPAHLEPGVTSLGGRLPDVRRADAPGGSHGG
jgi:hypothetical protein